MIATNTQAYQHQEKKGWLDRKIENSNFCKKLHPIHLTLFQLPLLCIVIWLFNSGWIFSSFFILGAFAWPLDWFDGRFARLLKKETQAGAFLDPLVDKIRFLLPITLFFSQIIWQPIIVMFWIIEGSLVATRIVKLINSKRKRKKARINAFSVGKVKSWGEMIGLLLIFPAYAFELSIFLWLAYIVLVPSLILACWSLYSHVFSSK